MRIIYANVGILEVYMICLVVCGLLLIMFGNNKISAIGRIVSFITLLTYVLLKSNAFY